MVKKGLNISLTTKILKNETFTLIFPKMNAYRRDLDETKYISFLIKDDELLEKYNKIWEKVENIIKKNLTVNQYSMKNI